jgi:hypothetical protein
MSRASSGGEAFQQQFRLGFLEGIVEQYASAP